MIENAAFEDVGCQTIAAVRDHVRQRRELEAQAYPKCFVAREDTELSRKRKTITEEK